jgi:CheY-like chemotaxis protein
VLIVEDDERQRDSIAKLLANGEVQITAVENAAEALAQLRATTFDCMVMDLNLPDLSGYELLQQMTEQVMWRSRRSSSIPGRSLTRDEEQSLRRFSKSIIIKDARSPERLLDEVTLFLHQVESQLPAERQLMLKAARDREATLDGRRILVVEDDVRNIFALTSLLEPKGAKIEIARNGREAIEALTRSMNDPAAHAIDLVLMDIMMPEMDGITAMREIRKRARVAQAADHRAHRQGDEGRSGKVPRRGRQRLHRQAPGRGEAAVARARMDAEVTSESWRPKTADIELQLLIDAIYLKYHYDFRGYAAASLKRRLTMAPGRFGCQTLSQLQDKVLHEPATFPALLSLSDRTCQRDVSRSHLFSFVAREGGSAPAHLSVAEGLGRRLQHR